MKDPKSAENKGASRSFKWRGSQVRPLTTDERASFVIVAFYLGLLCICTFLFGESISLRILGFTAASAGVFLFYAAFFNTEARGQGASKHPVRSYIMSLFIVLLVLFLLRLIGGLISSLLWSVVWLYAGLLVSLIVFRKAMLQVISMMLAGVFLFVMISNWQDILKKHMNFMDVVRQSGHVVFQIGPIQDVANLLISGNYMTYLNKINYVDPQLHIVAIRTVKGCNDDEWRKTEAILDFVSNEIHYVSDPEDGFEHARGPIITLIAGGGDCDDQSLLLCSLLESVGIHSYIAFTDDHVFALVRFSKVYPELNVEPHVYIDGVPCYALDASERAARMGQSLARPEDIRRIFEVRNKIPARFSIWPPDDTTARWK